MFFSPESIKTEKSVGLYFFSRKYFPPICFSVANTDPFLDHKLSHGFVPWRLRAAMWGLVHSNPHLFWYWKAPHLFWYWKTTDWFVWGHKHPCRRSMHPVNACEDLILLICGSPANIASFWEHVWQETGMPVHMPIHLKHPPSVQPSVCLVH